MGLPSGMSAILECNISCPSTIITNPLPMPFAELYNALESKAVDGQENPYSVILSSKFYEVQKYVSGTNHVYATNPVQISKRFWDKLSPAEHKILQDAATEAQTYQRVASREAAGKALTELQAKGMVYNAVAPAETARMRAAVQPIYAEARKLLGDELFKLAES